MTGIRVLVLDQARGLWGAQGYLLRLAGPLAERGVELVLAAPPELDLARAWTARGLPHVPIDLPLARSVRADGDGSRLSARAAAHEAAVLRAGARRIAEVAIAAGVDAIAGNGHAVHLDAALAGRRAGLPVVLHLHEEMEQRFGRAIRAAAVGRATASIAVSRAVARGVPAPLRGRVQVIPNGVDTAAFAPGPADPAVRASLGARPGDVLLVALTRLDPEKRIEDLLAAVAPLRDRPGWHLAIAGSTSSYPEYADRVRAAAEDLGDRVTFPGRREDVAAVLHAADVLVHAGVVEGMPLGLLEAQAAGVPVVAYRVAGVPEAVLDGRTGLLAAPQDAAGLGRHVERLIADPGLRATMGAAGRAHVVAAHDLQGQADAQAALLRRVLNRPAGAPRVLLVNHWHDDNRGDSAITQGILTLVRHALPGSEVVVTTLAEDGPLRAGGTRHLERFWPGLVSLPSPVPTELRGRDVERTRATAALDAGIWWTRLARHLPGLTGTGRSAAWRGLVCDADLVIAVGGSNVFDDAGVPAILSVPRLAEVLSPVHAAVRAGTPVLMLGHTLGPFSRPAGRAIARRLIAGATRVVVREATSVPVAQQLGARAVEEAPDLAFALVPEPSPAVDRLLAALPAAPRRTLALSVRRHPTLGAAADERLVDVFAQAARELVRAGAVDAVAVVAHTTGPTPVEDDRPISRLLVAELADVPVVLVDDDVSPAELSAFYGEVAAVVAVRLHAAILALAAGTPTFAVAYLTAKTRGVMTQVGLPGAVAEFATVQPADIAGEVSRQLADPGLRDTLAHRADVRRKELYEGAARWFATARRDAAP